jgi:hypothetical protein
VVAESQSGHDDQKEPWRSRGLWAGESAPAQMVIGLMMMTLGAFLLIGRFGLIELRGVWPLLGPLVFIGLGAAKLLTPRTDGGRHGVGLVLFGTWLLLNELHIWRAGDSWPIFLVALGIKIAWSAGSVTPRRLE